MLLPVLYHVGVHGRQGVEAVEHVPSAIVVHGGGGDGLVIVFAVGDDGEALILKHRGGHDVGRLRAPVVIGKIEHGRFAADVGGKQIPGAVDVDALRAAKALIKHQLQA